MNKNMNKAALRYTAAVVGFILLMLGLLLACLNTVAFNINHYETLYDSLDRYSATGMEREELLRVTEHTLDYMRGRQPEFNLQGVVSGETRQVFSERETAHMVDVQRLFLLELSVMWISLAAGVLLIALSQIGRVRRRGRMLAKGYIAGASVFVLLLAGIFILIARDFGAFWTRFHGVFFSNDLWILDPAQDMLIVMFPEPFFLDICLKIFISFGIIVVLGYALSIACLCFGRRRARKRDLI